MRDYCRLFEERGRNSKCRNSSEKLIRKAERKILIDSLRSLHIPLTEMNSECVADMLVCVRIALLDIVLTNFYA